MTRLLELVSSLIAPPITIVDVGAAGDLVSLGELDSLVEIHAIEPRSDVNTVGRGGAKIHRHNIGLAGNAGPRRLYVTKGAEASSLLEPNPEVARRYLPDAFDVVDEITIDCVTLADFAAASAIEYVDVLKIDTQGTELEILLSGKAFLDRVSIVSAEVEFVEIYRGQNLFDDMLRELSTRGFRFVDFTDGRRIGPELGKRIWADAVFVRRNLDRPAGLRAAAVLLADGHVGEAAWMLQDLGIDQKTIDDLCLAATHRSLRRRAVDRMLAINQARRAAGKISVNGFRLREMLRKMSFGILE